jgi:hypothetical protein
VERKEEGKEEGIEVDKGTKKCVSGLKRKAGGTWGADGKQGRIDDERCSESCKGKRKKRTLSDMRYVPLRKRDRKSTHSSEHSTEELLPPSSTRGK